MIADRYIVGLGVLMRADCSRGIKNAGSCVVILCSGHRPFRLRALGESRGSFCTSAVVPPGAEYVIEDEAVERVTAFIEADGILGRRARYEMDAIMCRGSAAWIDIGHRLVPADVWTHAKADNWEMAFHRLSGAFDRKRRGLAYAGAKVRRVTDLVESRLPDRVSLTELAGAVGLTQEQLTRLLLDEVGLPARPFVYWLRLRRYASLLADGATIDAAARATGYRRRWELTKDLRRLFGLSPSDAAACVLLAPLSGSSSAQLRIA